MISNVFVTLGLILSASANLAPWDITKLPYAQRKAVCDTQVATCQNDCGGPQYAPKAFCNVDTMGWGCGCATHAPTTQLWEFPVSVLDCQGWLQYCQNNCYLYENASNTCFFKCNSQYRCSTKDAPVSYLQVSTYDDVPAYTGPFVTYSGFIPGTDQTYVAPPPPPPTSSSQSQKTQASTAEGEKNLTSCANTVGAVTSLVLLYGFSFAAGVYYLGQ